MNATKLYVIFHSIVVIGLVAGITACAIHFNNHHLMWWYILPLLMGLEVKSK